MQILYAAFLSLSIIGIPAVSAQGTGIAHITSADASPNTKCLNVKSVDKGIPVEMLVHSTINDDQLMKFFI